MAGSSFGRSITLARYVALLVSLVALLGSLAKAQQLPQPQQQLPLQHLHHHHHHHQVGVSIVANWHEPSAITRGLETVALEKGPRFFWQLLSFLTRTNPHPLKAKLVRQHELSAHVDPSHAPLFSPFLAPNETLNVLLDRMMFARTLVGKGDRDSFLLSYANKEATPRIAAHYSAHSTHAADDGECDNYIDWYGTKVCDPKQWWALFTEQERRAAKKVLPVPHDPLTGAPKSPPELLPFDHLWPAPERNETLPLAILHAEPSSMSFQPLLQTLLRVLDIPEKHDARLHLSQLAQRARVQVALRWRPLKPSLEQANGMVLSGYGAALDIKKSEYLAIDDRQTTTSAPAADDDDENAEHVQLTPVKKSDVAYLSLRAAAHVLAAESPLDELVSLTGSFPLRAAQLASKQRPSDDALARESSDNKMQNPLASLPGPSFLVNGIPLTPSEVDPFALMRILRAERTLIQDILAVHHKLHFRFARDLLMHPNISRMLPGASSSRARFLSPDGRVSPEILGELFDASDRDEGTGSVLLWWNDLEKDKRYASYTKNVRDLLKPAYPGSMNLIARNLNNVVLALDLSNVRSLTTLTKNVAGYIARGIPVRFGVVPIISDDAPEHGSVKNDVAKVLWYLVDAIGRARTMVFLDDLVKSSAGADVVSAATLRDVYSRVASSTQHNEGGPLAPLDDVLIAKPFDRRDPTSRFSKTLAYLRRLALDTEAFFMDGSYFALDDSFANNLQETLTAHTQFLQQQVYVGEITERTHVANYFYDLPTAHSRRNAHTYGPLRLVNLPEAFEGSHFGFRDLFYIEGAPEGDVDDAPPVVTMWLIADYTTEEGRELARHALDFVDRTADTRIALVHNPVNPEPAHEFTLPDVMYALFASSTLPDVLPVELLHWIDMKIGPDGPPNVLGKAWTKENPILPWLGGVRGDKAAAARDFWARAQPFVRNVGLQPGEAGIVVNGRVLGPIKPRSFESDDLRDLRDYELRTRIGPLMSALKSLNIDSYDILRDQFPLKIAYLSSLVWRAFLDDPAAGLFGRMSSQRHSEHHELLTNHTAYITENDDALFEITAIMDPATETAQRWAPILKTLSEIPSFHVRLHLNPTYPLSEVPIKRFYKFTFPSTPAFDGYDEAPGGLGFDGLPEDELLTLSIDAHRSWLAFPESSVHDLDNIRLRDLPRHSQVSATFKLENLIVDGHARDMPTAAPPRGLQLELSSASTKGDTIVMANLGYFQLKGNPGMWDLSIRDGRSSDVFELESIGANGWNDIDTGTRLTVNTLEGATLYPRFRRKPGHQLTQLLEEDAPVAGKSVVDNVLGKVKSMLPFLAPKPKRGAGADINIFTVASGLLYERMAFIMITSVMRHTKSTVKFWFIQNFLSPSFKAFIPHMAQAYGFEYELVTYKWPHWLRAQKEKQRVIWGYKILFLDVLFPLDVDRVIFVDSDQIVRTDLKELVDMDLQGAPYAYAPMGDDRKEMEGFRFWKSGYWADHLRGRPYHISALYVVDLDRFRQIAAGDRLRQQYHMLSGDASSLANLDQDLPNNMQATIPIHTLDQSWLWCETWCSDESLADAKTIDLCNNPLTHEPKLARAKRLVPEWTEYDDEVARLAARVADSASDAKAFVGRADELGQAKEQSKEFAHHAKDDEAKEETPMHVKDEL